MTWIAVAAGGLKMTQGTRTFVFVGILGGFTTFSSFGLDTLALAHDGRIATALVNVLAQIGVGIAACSPDTRWGLPPLASRGAMVQPPLRMAPALLNGTVDQASDDSSGSSGTYRPYFPRRLPRSG
jgi:hypothetical protein